MNARDIAKTKVGTPENEIISTISVATSAIVTTLVIVAGGYINDSAASGLGKSGAHTRVRQRGTRSVRRFGLKVFYEEPQDCGSTGSFHDSAVCICAGGYFQTSLLMIPAGGMALLIGYFLFKKGKL